MTCPSIALPPSGMMKVTESKSVPYKYYKGEVDSLLPCPTIFPRWRPDAIKGGGGGGRGGEEDENKPTNYPNEILPDFHGGSLVSHFYEQGKASQ